MLNTTFPSYVLKDVLEYCITHQILVKLSRPCRPASRARAGLSHPSALPPPSIRKSAPILNLDQLAPMQPCQGPRHALEGSRASRRARRVRAQPCASLDRGPRPKGSVQVAPTALPWHPAHGLPTGQAHGQPEDGRDEHRRCCWRHFLRPRRRTAPLHRTPLPRVRRRARLQPSNLGRDLSEGDLVRVC